MSEAGRTPVIFRLLTETKLESGSKKRAPPDYVLRMPEKKSLMFAFPVDKLLFGPANRYVVFSMNLNEILVRVRFDLRAGLLAGRLPHCAEGAFACLYGPSARE